MPIGVGCDTKTAAMSAAYMFFAYCCSCKRSLNSRLQRSSSCVAWIKPAARCLEKKAILRGAAAVFDGER